MVDSHDRMKESTVALPGSNLRYDTDVVAAVSAATWTVFKRVHVSPRNYPRDAILLLSRIRRQAIRALRTSATGFSISAALPA
jgi:hypothetical protein